MPCKFYKEENVDIFQLPQPDNLITHERNKEIQQSITIGDLHGNAMKLMFMLVKHGIATNINEDEYLKLVEIYKTPVEDLTKKYLDEFNQILSKIEFSNTTLVRLIGDELADRGNNDYFTLKILEKLHQHKVLVEIILSNHSIEFIEAYESEGDFVSVMLEVLARSMANLHNLIEKNIVTRNEILDIVNTSYKPTLRAISYSLSKDQKEITIYSHAGIGLNTIESLADKLQVQYQDENASLLAGTIHNINVQFQIHVRQNTVKTLYNRDEIYNGLNCEKFSGDTPLEFIMWNRFYKGIDRPMFVNFDYKVNFVHGHDSDDPDVSNDDTVVSNIYNLDNLLGKAADYHQGEYTVFYSSGEVMAPKIEYKEKDRIDQQQATEFFLEQLGRVLNLKLLIEQVCRFINSFCSSLHQSFILI